MTDHAPFPIMAAPIAAYWAPVGEAFPLVEVAPAGNWALIGTSGDRSISEAGVTITPNEEHGEARVLGSTGPVKVWRISEGFTVSFEIFDMSLEHLKHTFNRNAVTDTAGSGGVAGLRRIDLYRGLDVDQIALLLRAGYSAYGDSWNHQFNIPVVVQMGSPTLVYTKGSPVGLALTYKAIEDPSAATVNERYGRMIMQDSAIIP